MFRWYDCWIKGIDNGVMDEPAVNVYVEGSRRRMGGSHWPPKEIDYRALYLRPRGRLSLEPEPLGLDHAIYDGFFQAPLTVTDKIEMLTWSSEPFTQETADDRHRGGAHLR